LWVPLDIEVAIVTGFANGKLSRFLPQLAGMIFEAAAVADGPDFKRHSQSDPHEHFQ
jgi:hypothetical protein